MCVHVDACMCVKFCVCACVYIYMYIYIYVYIYICMYIYIHEYMCVCVHTSRTPELAEGSQDRWSMRSVCRLMSATWPKPLVSCVLIWGSTSLSLPTLPPYLSRALSLIPPYISPCMYLCMHVRMYVSLTLMSVKLFATSSVISRGCWIWWLCSKRLHTCMHAYTKPQACWQKVVGFSAWLHTCIFT